MNSSSLMISSTTPRDFHGGYICTAMTPEEFKAFVFPTGAELLALYNHPPVREGQMKYYTVKVPLRVQNCDEGVKGVEANWLDHMTQHFNSGASLVDGYFHLGNGNGEPNRSDEMSAFYSSHVTLSGHTSKNRRCEFKRSRYFWSWLRTF